MIICVTNRPVTHGVADSRIYFLNFKNFENSLFWHMSSFLVSLPTIIQCLSEETRNSIVAVFKNLEYPQIMQLLWILGPTVLINRLEHALGKREDAPFSGWISRTRAWSQYKLLTTVPPYFKEKCVNLIHKRNHMNLDDIRSTPSQWSRPSSRLRYNYIVHMVAWCLDITKTNSDVCSQEVL